MLKAGIPFKARMIQTDHTGKAIIVYPKDSGESLNYGLIHDLIIFSPCEYHADVKQLTIMDCLITVETFINGKIDRATINRQIHRKY